MKTRPKQVERLVDFYDFKKCGISQSALKTFMSCRRKWMLNIAGLSRKGTQENTHFGSIVHEMLEQVYQKIHILSPDKIENFVRKHLEKYLDSHKDAIHISTDQNDTEKEMAIAIVDGYFKHFAKDRNNFVEIEPEYEFAFPYGDVTLRGKVDGVVTFVNRDRWQLEHKTKSRIDEESILAALQFDFQNLMYSFVLDQTNPMPIRGVLYNIIRKPQLRKGKDETTKQFLDRIKADIALRPEFYFIRYEVVYTKKDKRNFKGQLDGILGEIQLFVKGGLPDLQNPAHCLFPFKCEYLGVCSAGSTVGLELRESIHPELDEETFRPDPRILANYGIKM